MQDAEFLQQTDPVMVRIQVEIAVTQSAVLRKESRQRHVTIREAEIAVQAPGRVSIDIMTPQQIRSTIRDFLGLNVADPITSSIGEAGAIVGDAIDDLADIARDLYDVEWCWANTSEANALFHLEQGYRTHWRRHLREFQLYLDALELDRDLAD